jgi:hypothetical protein
MTTNRNQKIEKNTRAAEFIFSRYCSICQGTCQDTVVYNGVDMVTIIYSVVRWRLISYQLYVRSLNVERSDPKDIC